MAQHIGPAGSRYPSLTASGDAHRKQHCAGFPDSDESVILPQLLLTKYPEKKDPATGDVVVAKQLEGTNSVVGLQGNARGK